MDIEYIVVARSRVGKVEDLAICTSLGIAREYAKDFASGAPPHSTITIFRAETIETQNGREDAQ